MYGNVVGLDSLSLTVEQGEVFGFLGPNGAGKSTFVKLLMGLVHPTSGSASLFGQAIDCLEVKHRVGFLPEAFRFPDWMRARELLDFHAKLAGLAPARRNQRAREVLALVGLTDRADHALRTYSKGMLQRIGIAQALVADPDIVFLDEPTSALDPLGRRDVRDLIRHLRGEGKTVFLNSHLLSEIELVCDRVAIVNRGRVVRQGNLTDLLTRSELDVRVSQPSEELLGALRSQYHVVSEAEGSITLALTNEDQIPQVADIVHHHGGRLYGLIPHRNSLEDLFAEVVEGSERQ